jgi:hypothetical protein
MRRILLIGITVLASACIFAAEHKEPSKGLLFFYRIGNRVDHYLTQNIDTDYISLPEHSWRIAYTNAMVGVHSTLSSSTVFPDYGEVNFALANRTTPSVDLGFYAGYRGLGFGYSWDALHAYAQRLSFSLGSKFIGIDFNIQTSTNITTNVSYNGDYLWDLGKTDVVITNASLNVWYALNAVRYSHQAAVKQSYIQRKTAGSPLIFLSYMSSQVDLRDSVEIPEAQRPLLPALMSSLTAVRTRQMAIGIGYGINYTPNHGKVILHASAAAQLVTYTVNLVSYYLPDSIGAGMPSQPMFNLQPSFPVHITGNVRAAISWEINKWVHLSVWATGENIRFRSKPTYNQNTIQLSNWDWKVQATIGVRLGAGKERVNRALADSPAPEAYPKRQSKLPRWVLEYFYSPRL